MIAIVYKAKARIRVSIVGTSLQDKVRFIYQMTFYIIQSPIITRFLEPKKPQHLIGELKEGLLIRELLLSKTSLFKN